MEHRGLVAGALALLAATASCAPPADGGEGGLSSEPELPLELTLDHLDVVHGSMRLRATMVGGSPDVSIVLGGDCDRQDVGHGFATRVSLVWTFDERDVAEALRCGLIARAHAWSDRGRIVETATLEVAPDVVPVPEAGANGQAVAADEGTTRPELDSIGRDPTEMSLAFRSLTRSATLAVADLRIERAEDEDDEENSDDSTAAFSVPYEAFARALLEDRPLRIDGTRFATALTVGGLALERESPAEVEEPSAEGETAPAEDVEAPADVAENATPARVEAEALR